MARSLMFEDENDPFRPLATRRNYGDEPMGGYGPPPPAPPSPAPIVASKRPSLDIDPYVEQLNRVNAAQAARPEDPKPKLWQRLLAGGIGGLGGAVNAGGRVSVDTGPVTDEILAPGYKRQMANWQQGVADARMGADTEAAKLTWLQKMQDAESQRGLRESQAGAAQARAGRDRAAMNAPPKPSVFNMASGGALVGPDGKVIFQNQPPTKPPPTPRPITSVNDAGDMVLIDPTDPTKRTVVPGVGKKARQSRVGSQNSIEADRQLRREVQVKVGEYETAHGGDYDAALASARTSPGLAPAVRAGLIRELQQRKALAERASGWPTDGDGGGAPVPTAGGTPLRDRGGIR